jgi:molybdopterin synthase catalytic subunit
VDNIQIHAQPYDPWETVKVFQEERFGHSAEYGATSVFSGTMRDFNEGNSVSAMTLEHYPGMTENHLQAIIDEAHSRWEIIECLLVHRVGDIQPAETIMLAAVWSAHRREAFEACRYLVEELKHRAPFWKKETLTSGETRWVEDNTPG